MKHLRITVEGKVYDVEVEFLDENAAAAPAKETRPLRGVQSSTSKPQPSTVENKQSSAPVTEGAVLSPLSAVVVSVDVAIGDTVEKGQKVITLEAMKMNTIVSASAAGTVEAIQVSVGDAVEEGQALITVS
jgi:glutaconyl-CoA/methylmalonyl-CoA decarboxylase subunit gamma